MDSMDQQARHGDSSHADASGVAERMMQAAVRGEEAKPAPAQQRPVAPSRDEAHMSDAMQAELDKAMRSEAFTDAPAPAHTHAGAKPAPGAPGTPGTLAPRAPGAKPAIRGPRHRGRGEHRGTRRSVGPTDISSSWA